MKKILILTGLIISSITTSWANESIMCQAINEATLNIVKIYLGEPKSEQNTSCRVDTDCVYKWIPGHSRCGNTLVNTVAAAKVDLALGSPELQRMNYLRASLSHCEQVIYCNNEMRPPGKTICENAQCIFKPEF